MRHRAMLLYLRDVRRVDSTATSVLHVAPEKALQPFLSSIQDSEYVAVDLDSPLASVHADLTQLPFADETFDLILCSHVLEHVPDDRLAIRELFRVLRPDGTAVIQVPIWDVAETVEDASVTTSHGRYRLFGQWDHVRICGADYGFRLEEAGFAVTIEDPVKHIDEAARTEFRLRTGEPLYLCTKTRPGSPRHPEARG